MAPRLAAARSSMTSTRSTLGGDADEHREERRVGDERDLRGLAEAEPHEEHRQERQRRDRPHELDHRLQHQPERRAERGQRSPRASAAAAAMPKPCATRASEVTRLRSRLPSRSAATRDPRHLARRRQQHRVHDLHRAVAVGDGTAHTASDGRAARARDASLVHLRDFFLHHARDLALVVRELGGEAVADLRQLDLEHLLDAPRRRRSSPPRGRRGTRPRGSSA